MPKKKTTRVKPVQASKLLTARIITPRIMWIRTRRVMSWSFKFAIFAGLVGAAAKKSAARHDKAIVLEVAAELMVQHGYRFFVTENHIWLTDHVPPDYLNQRFSQ